MLAMLHGATENKLNPLSLDGLYFYFFLHWVFVAACGLSLVAGSRG